MNTNNNNKQKLNKKARKSKRRVRRRRIGSRNLAPIRKNINQFRISRLAPVNTNTYLRNNPIMRNIRVKHREFITEIARATTETTYTRTVNPGLENMFPWLSRLASCFETYRWNRLEFHFIPTCPSDTAGGFAMVPDYDATDPPFEISKQKLYAHADTVRGNLWAPLVCRCTLANLRKMKSYYIRSKPLDNGDKKLYDALRFYYAVGSGSPMVVGELWISYDITLQTPQLESNTLASSAFLNLYDTSNSVTPFSGFSGAIPQNGGDFSFKYYDATHAIVFLNAGYYAVTITGSCTGSSAITGLATLALYNTSGSAVTSWSIASDYDSTATVSSPMYYFKIFKLDEDDVKITSSWDGPYLSWAGVTMTGGAFDLHSCLQITQLTYASFQFITGILALNEKSKSSKPDVERQVKSLGM